jgi:dihydroorotase
MASLIIRNATIINRNTQTEGDIFVKNGRIEKVSSGIDSKAEKEIDAAGKIVMPGIIDDQVHFREPGLTHKANIFTEATAAVAGGVTAFMEMPNTKPTSTTLEALEAKYEIASKNSLPNYSFYIGATNDNLETVLQADTSRICGIKVFMGSSTGNMLVDDTKTLEGLFSKGHMLIATHCEDETTIRKNVEIAKEKYGQDIPMTEHPIIRNREACILSSSKAIELAKRYGTRLHILHISTADEVALFDHKKPLVNKLITSEACVHHLSFADEDYKTLGGKIKCNPAIKTANDRDAILKGVLDHHIDVIATDHAPHTWEEKNNKYLNCPSGLPLVQHTLDLMMQHVRKGKISLKQMVDKMCHAPAICFQIKERGYLDEGNFADIVIYNPNHHWEVNKSNLLYKCGWSPLEGRRFHGKVETTIVNGHIAYHKGIFDRSQMGMRMTFAR